MRLPSADGGGGNEDAPRVACRARATCDTEAMPAARDCSRERAIGRTGASRLVSSRRLGSRYKSTIRAQKVKEKEEEEARPVETPFHVSEVLCSVHS